MATQRDFYDKPLYIASEYGVAFVLSNIYFILCNIPAIYYSLVVALDPDAFSVLMLFIFMIPTGPAITALCCSMGKLFRDKEISITNYFFTSYKKNFLSSLKLWAIQLTIIFIFLMDYQYFIQKGNIFLPMIFIALIVYIIVMGLYAFPILSRFELKTKSLVLISLYYAVRKFHITILKVVLFIATYYLYIKIPFIGILCLFSLLSYVTMFYDNSMLLELENKQVSHQEVQAISE